MVSKKTHTTRAIAFRIPNEVYAILERRALKCLATRNPKLDKVSDYIKDRIIYDALRKR